MAASRHIFPGAYGIMGAISTTSRTQFAAPLQTHGDENRADMHIATAGRVQHQYNYFVREPVTPRLLDPWPNKVKKTLLEQDWEVLGSDRTIVRILEDTAWNESIELRVMHDAWEYYPGIAALASCADKRKQRHMLRLPGGRRLRDIKLRSKQWQQY